MKTLVTGCAGFIGYHTTQRLLSRGDEVVGIDILNDYYDVNLKHARLAQLTNQNFRFIKLDIADQSGVATLFAQEKFTNVINLAAQAGVSYSLSNPHAYISSNIIGFTNILEGCRHNSVAHLTYASSSSVYGLNEKMPLSTHDAVDHPVSFYAATKKANELMAHSYSHLYNLPTTGLRFFTVYGPWGRPDMAISLFTEAMIEGREFPVYDSGDTARDFTYIDDVVEIVVRVNDKIATPNEQWSAARPEPNSSSAPFRIFNVGNSSPVKLSRIIEVLEAELGCEAKRDVQPKREYDVTRTFASPDSLEADIGFSPGTSFEAGVARFVEWYRWYQVRRKDSLTEETCLGSLVEGEKQRQAEIAEAAHCEAKA